MKSFFLRLGVYLQHKPVWAFAIVYFIFIIIFYESVVESDCLHLVTPIDKRNFIPIKKFDNLFYLILIPVFIFQTMVSGFIYYILSDILSPVRSLVVFSVIHLTFLLYTFSEQYFDAMITIFVIVISNRYFLKLKIIPIIKGSSTKFFKFTCALFLSICFAVYLNNGGIILSFLIPIYLTLIIQFFYYKRNTKLHWF